MNIKILKTGLELKYGLLLLLPLPLSLLEPGNSVLTRHYREKDKQLFKKMYNESAP